MSDAVGSYRTTRVLVVLFILLSMLTVWQFVTGRNTQSDVDLINRQVTHLCETGAIDCTGTPGLPGPKGIAGTGLKDVGCDETTEQWVIEFTNGKVARVGDCVAVDGVDGRDGRDGARGPQGERGSAGPRGASCVEQLSLRRCQGPQGLRGPRGHKGLKGLPGQGPKGNPGKDLTRADVRQIVSSMLGQYVTKSELARVVQRILDQINEPPPATGGGTLES